MSWFAVGNLTVFTVIPLKTVSTQTKHVFPRGQGCDGGAPIKADPTYISTSGHTSGSAQPALHVQSSDECRVSYLSARRRRRRDQKKSVSVLSVSPKNIKNVFKILEVNTTLQVKSD